MEQTAHLSLFFVMVLGIVVLPGLDMAFVMASALVGGRRSGLAATAGIIAGGFCHVALGALGIMAVLEIFPAAFNLVLLAGAAYVAYIGWSLVRSQGMGGPEQEGEGEGQRPAARSQAATFRLGMVTNLLNPKAYLFMLAIFPQFIKKEYGPLWTQAIVLGLIIAACQAAIYGGMALGGDRVKAWLSTRPGAELGLARGVGVLLMLVSLVTAAEGWRGI